MEDHHVDRPDVKARQRVKLTGTNRSFDLIALVAKARARESARGRRMTGAEGQIAPPSLVSVAKSATSNQFCFDRTSEDARQATENHLFRPPSPVLRRPNRPLPAWWLLQGDQTRSHPELGRQTP